MREPLHLEPGTVVAGDFRVVRMLAEGGMGRVYQVDQLSTGKARALKILRPGLADDRRMRERFVREATVSARIESDHVVEVIAAGVDEATSTPWLAMEFLHGVDLDGFVHAKGRLSLDEVREIVAQLGHALAAAHAVGIVHRDLKPENVFVAHPRRAGAPFTVKLLDFGIAKFVQESAPTNAGVSTAPLATTSAIGSPLWMAPEQINLQPIGPFTDVWALGLLVYWMLAGEDYWRTAGTTVEALLAEKLFGPLDAASVRAGAHARWPEGFDGWFEHCVARDPSMRFRDAGAACTALISLLGGEARPFASSLPTVNTRPDVVRNPSTASLGSIEIPRAPAAGPDVGPLRIVAASALVATLIAGGVFSYVKFHHGDTDVPPRAVAAPPASERTPLVVSTPAPAPEVVAPPAPTVAPAVTAPPRAASHTPAVHAAHTAHAAPAPNPPPATVAVTPTAPAPAPPSNGPGVPPIAQGLALVTRQLNSFEDRAEAAERAARDADSTNPNMAASQRSLAQGLHGSADDMVAGYRRLAANTADPAQAEYFRTLATEGAALLARRRAAH